VESWLWLDPATRVENDEVVDDGGLRGSIAVALEYAEMGVICMLI
jgi:hypothetical protein